MKRFNQSSNRFISAANERLFRRIFWNSNKTREINSVHFVLCCKFSSIFYLLLSVSRFRFRSNQWSIEKSNFASMNFNTALICAPTSNTFVGVTRNANTASCKAIASFRYFFLYFGRFGSLFLYHQLRELFCLHKYSWVLFKMHFGCFFLFFLFLVPVICLHVQCAIPSTKFVQRGWVRNVRTIREWRMLYYKWKINMKKKRSCVVSHRHWQTLFIDVSRDGGWSSWCARANVSMCVCVPSNAWHEPNL